MRRVVTGSGKGGYGAKPPAGDGSIFDNGADRLLQNADANRYMDVPPEQAEVLSSSSSDEQPSTDEESSGDDVLDGLTVPAELPPPPRRVFSFLGMVSACWALLRPRLGAILLLGALQDFAVFALHQAGNAVTNLLAITILRGPYTFELLSPIFWLAPEALATHASGYGWLQWLVTAAALPVKLLVQAVFVCATIALVTSEPQRVEGNVFKRVAGAVRNTFRALNDSAPQRRRVAFTLGWSLLNFILPAVATTSIIFMPWGLPRIIHLLGAAPASYLQGYEHKEALQRGKALLHPHWKQIALPFAVLTLGPRIALALKNYMLTHLPAHIWPQVPELPLLISLGMPVLSVILFRMQEMLPVLAYQAAVTEEAPTPGGEEPLHDIQAWLHGDQVAPITAVQSS